MVPAPAWTGRTEGIVVGFLTKAVAASHVLRSRVAQLLSWTPLRSVASCVYFCVRLSPGCMFAEGKSRQT